MDNKQIESFLEKTAKSEHEELCQSYFKEESTLKTIRAVLLNIEPSKEDLAFVKDLFKNEALRRMFRDRFLGIPNKDAQIGAYSDFWLGAETDLYGADKTKITQTLIYKENVRKMLEENLERMFEGKPANFDLEYKDDDDLATNLISRNQYIRNVETNLVFIKVLANKREASYSEESK